MITFLLKLILAHLIGDFLLQTEKGVRNKYEKQERSKYLYLHIGIHTLALLLLLQFNMDYWLGILIIVVTHYFIDLTKIKLHRKANERLLFFADQLLHFTVIATVVYFYFPYALNPEILLSKQVLALSIFLLLITVVASIVMKVLISRWDLSTISDVNSLEKAGTYIGMLERLFVFGFIVINYWGGIGFLITAKSVFRFGDLSKANDRKLTEYVLIGTLLSFGISILCGLAYRYLIEIL